MLVGLLKHAIRIRADEMHGVGEAPIFVAQLVHPSNELFEQHDAGKDHVAAWHGWASILYS